MLYSGTVADLALDIRRALARRPVFARHPLFSYRAKCIGQANGSRLVAGAAFLFCWPECCSRFGLVLNKLTREAAGTEPRQPRTAWKIIAVLPFDSLGEYPLSHIFRWCSMTTF